MSRFKNWLPPYFDAQNYAWNRVKASYIGQHYVKGDICYGWRCFHPDNLKLGYGCDIGAFSLLQAKYGIKLGEDVELGPHVYICSHSTIDNKQGKVIIKDGAKIGAGSIILPNVIIGKNSIIGAGSVVLCDTKIPDNELWVGIPCRKKKVI